MVECSGRVLKPGMLPTTRPQTLQTSARNAPSEFAVCQKPSARSWASFMHAVRKTPSWVGNAIRWLLTAAGQQSVLRMAAHRCSPGQDRGFARLDRWTTTCRWLSTSWCRSPASAPAQQQPTPQRSRPRRDRGSAAAAA